jgi:signal transduction histidine kinase
VQVTDEGGGISPHDQPRVFNRFYRAENVLIQGLGDTGVGLSIAKALTEAQHGRIWVESGEGRTTFSVLLPMITPANAEKKSKSKGSN